MSQRYMFSAAIGIALGACDAVDTTASVASSDPMLPTSTTQQNGITMQGITMQGITMQGITMQGMTMQGMRLDGATLGGDPLDSVRVVRGEVVAQRAGAALHGSDLIGAHFLADVHDPSTSPPTAAVVEYRVTDVEPEAAQYDPTHTGNTFLYTLEQWVPDTASWQPACPTDDDGRSVAIPLSAVWDDHGDLHTNNTQFTFGCTTGVIAKCYRWGYRPWVTGYGDLATVHWTCTRMARADYCGNGTPHTRNGTTINIWDTLPAPGPIQRHGGVLPPTGMLFEAGWDTGGAVCLSHARWLLDDTNVLAAVCPQRLVAPSLLGGTVCDSMSAVLGYDPKAVIFNEAYLNVSL